MMAISKAFFAIAVGFLQHGLVPIVERVGLGRNTEKLVGHGGGWLIALPVFLITRRNIFEEPRETAADFNAFVSSGLFIWVGVILAHVYEDKKPNGRLRQLG